MDRPLEVLLIEPDRGGEVAADELADHGHHVHRCRPPGAGAGPRCRAVTDDDCPLDHGIDVALVAGPAGDGRSSLDLPGVVCAIRQHVPMVATPPHAEDPELAPHLVGGVDGPPSESCTRAVEARLDELRADIRRRTAQALVAAGLEPGPVGVRLAPAGDRLTVTLSGPPRPPSVQQTLGVRALDAVRAGRRRPRQVDVAYEVEPGA